ncbi:MAG: condensation domain-containing protein [Solirubrobacteraceae bacterium]
MSVPEPAQRTVPASPAQRLLWLMERRTAGGLNDRLAWRVRGRLDLDALAGALALLQRRHEALRTGFESSGRALVQVVRAPGALAVEHEAGPADAPALDAVAARPLDSGGPPVAVHLWRHGPEDRTLLIVLHQLVTDPRSSEILARELGPAYERARGGRAGALPEIGWQYADWCAWQEARLSGERLRSLQGWWRSELAGAALPALPATGDGARGAKRYARRRLPEAVAGGIRRRAAAAATTPFVVALTALRATLHALTGQSDLALASLFANRRPEVEHTIGPFANMIVLRDRFAPGAPFAAQLAAGAGAVARAQAHAELPFGLLPPGALGAGGGRVEDLVFQFRDGEPRASALARIPGLDLEPVERQPDRARFAVELFVALLSDGVAPVVLYDSGRVPDAWAAALADGYCAQLSGLARAAGTPTADARQARAVSS